MRRCELEAGGVLFKPEDPAECVYFVEMGRLGVQAETGFNDRLQVVAPLESGAVVGESGFVSYAGIVAGFKSET